jgi:hypothetical protein
MHLKRIFTLVGGLAAGLLYAFLAMFIVQQSHAAVSLAFVFAVPLSLGAIPVLFSTHEQLHSYLRMLLLPWVTVLTFFYLALVNGFEGMICLVIIVGPFLVLGGLGAFLYRLVKLRRHKEGQRALYVSLTLPFLVLLLESQVVPADYAHTVRTQLVVNAPREVVWAYVKNVRNIRPGEIALHFVHLIGVPRPLNGELTYEGIGAERRITWEQGISFVEKITDWQEDRGFAYDIRVDPASIPPQTLDEHVLVGGRYFDVLRGGYQLEDLGGDRTRVTLSCQYRITTTLNAYGALWADFLLNDFNEMILEVIRNRAEYEVRAD